MRANQDEDVADPSEDEWCINAEMPNWTLEGLTSGRQESLTSGRHEGLTSGRHEGLTSGRHEDVSEDGEGDDDLEHERRWIGTGVGVSRQIIVDDSKRKELRKGLGWLLLNR